MSIQKPGQPAKVDVQAVVQILSGKISSLTIENAMLQARVGDLEQKLRAADEKDTINVKNGGKEK